MRQLIYVIVGFFLTSFSSSAQSDVCESAGAQVIALGGAVTEMIYALGEEDRIVGVDVTSTVPSDTSKLPKLGYYRSVGAEGLLSLGPDMIIADPDAGPPEALGQVSSVGVCIRKVGRGGSAQAVLDRVNQIASALNIPEKGKELRVELAAEFDDAENLVALKKKSQPAPKILFLLSAKDGAPVAAGQDTDANAIIELAGGINAVSGFTGYKPLSSEVAASSAADYILMMSHVVQGSGGKEAILSLPQLQLTPAGKNGNLISMDGLLLLGFGPRTPAAIKSLTQQIF
tara:strand:+ start:6774 stop:7634 length:861 start_codon:yes stop_codon:yes gene_type:complete